MTNKLLPALSLLLVACCSCALKAQELVHYGLADGLSCTEITAICEDDNYIWIATEDGLNRFDGHHFKVYKAGKGPGGGMRHNHIETLFVDSEGLLWLGFKSGGVDVYNPHTGRFTPLDSLVGQPLPRRVFSIFEDSGHNIWLGGWEERICRLTPDNKERSRFTATYGQWECIASSFAEKPKGQIWIGTYTGLVRYDSRKQEWKSMSAGDQVVTDLYDTGEPRTLYYSSWDNALHKLAWTDGPERIQTTRLHDAGTPVFCLLGSGGRLLAGTWGDGVKVCGKDGGRPLPLPGTEHWGTTFVYDLFKDRAGNVWIGSYGKGLYKYADRDRGTFRLTASPVPHSPVSSIAGQQDRLLLGTLGDGMYAYDMETGAMRECYKTGNKESDHILAIEQYGDLTLVGHDGTGLLYSFGSRDGSRPEWKEFRAGKELAKATAFCFDGDRVWIGTKQNGLMSVGIDGQTKEMTGFAVHESAGRERINAIIPYRDGRLFIASYSGLAVFDKSEQRAVGRKVIDDETVYSIIEDQHNRCWWVGTSGSLLKMVQRGDSLHISPAFPSYPLPQGAVKSLLLDSNHNLWFFIGDRVFCHIDSEHRLCEPDIGHWGNLTILTAEKVLRGGREYILCGDTEQVIAIDTEKALNQKDETRLILTDLEVDHRKVQASDTLAGRVVLTENPEYAHAMTLPHDAKWISLAFTETGETGYRNKYLYRMAGFTDEWQHFDASVPLTFSRLNPGKYALEIKRYDEAPDAGPCWAMDITVVPPWWKTPLFRAAVALAVLLAVVSAVRLVILRNKKENLRKLRAMETLKKEELLKEKESFFDSLGHDLITPLSLILAPANDLLRETDETDARHEKLSIISKNATFLSDLFSTILDFKRVELSDMAVCRRNVEAVSFCRTIVNAFNYLADSKQIQLDFQSAIPSAHVWIDQVKFERILYNLLSNAVKYTPHQGRVSVALEYADGLLAVSVKDTGPGINPSHQAAVFDKFYREPQYDKENSPGGLGLGLYVVKKFVAAMDGTVSVCSRPGEGTTLCVKLPAEQAGSRQPAADIPEPDPQTNDTAGHATILLVEDNEQILNYLAAQLAGHFNIVTATNGEEALEQTEHHLPEIIISDIIMPGMDGLELCRHIKENPLYADIFMILLTAKTSAEDELKGYKGGADIYIRKPFDTAALASQISNILNTRQKRKEQLLKSLTAQGHAPVEFNSKEVFLQQAMKVIEENLDKADFNIEEFAAAMNISKTVLHKKFKMLIGQTPNQFIRAVRIRKASELLESTDLSVTEIAYLTGFNQAHYFIKCFKEVYDETPKNFRERKRKGPKT